MTSAGGSWFPHVGDPTLAGWTCVAFYVVAVVACVRALRRHRAATWGTSTYWWTVIVALILLGVNKQLDLQTWVLQSARDVFGQQAWARHWRSWAGVLAIGIGAVVAWLAWHLLQELAPLERGVQATLLGVVALVVPMLYRMSGLPGARMLMLHVFDGERGVFHTHVKELLEIGALLAITAGAGSVSGANDRPAG